VLAADLEVLGEHDVHTLLVAVDDLGLLDGVAGEQLETLLSVHLLVAVTPAEADHRHAEPPRADDPQRDAGQGAARLAAGGLGGICHGISPRTASARARPRRGACDSSRGSRARSR